MVGLAPNPSIQHHVWPVAAAGKCKLHEGKKEEMNTDFHCQDGPQNHILIHFPGLPMQGCFAVAIDGLS